MPRYSGGSEAVDAGNLREWLFKFYDVLLTPKYAVLFLVFIASAIRLIPMRFKYLLGYDPYFHLAYIKYALTHGWVNFFPYALGPWGYLISSSHPFGFWMAPFFIYRLLHPLGVSLYNTFRITPVIFGVLTVLFVYLAILRLYGRKEALASSFFMAISFAHIFRSMAGYYRGDNYMLFWYSVALFGIAMALSKNEGKWRHKRLLFYLVPAFAAGFSAIFWEAYYPIFVFLLVSAVFIAVGSFLLEKDNFLDAIALVFSVVIGILISNALGTWFGYGMGGPTHALGKTLAAEFGLNFGFINDAVLLMYLKYAIPLSIVVILGLFGLSRIVKGHRILITLVILAVFAGIGLKYYGMISGVLTRLFPATTVVEMRRTGLSDLWLAYGVSIVLTPFFFTAFALRKEDMGDFVLLGPIIVQLLMMLLWTRFLFMASMAVAIMAGIGLVRVSSLALPRFNKKVVYYCVVLLLLLSIPAVTAVQSIENTVAVRPLMNKNWEVALTHFGMESHPNDVVMTWWDHGHWVTYYAMRAPVAQGSPSKDVAEYYLGLKGEDYLMSSGVDYVIVSLDTVQKFEAVLQTAGASGYAMVVLMPVLMTNTMIFSAPGYEIMATPGKDGWGVKVSIGGRWGVPEELWVERGKSIESVKINGQPTIDAYVYINLNYGYAVLMNRKAFETPLAKLMFTDNYSTKYSLIYSDGGLVKIYKFTHPNVEVTSREGRIIFIFENATGTVLGIRGYLDNGTLVYAKEFDVKGKKEFFLPENLNGSVVIRYTYFKGHTPLDRGVFRIGDVIKKS